MTQDKQDAKLSIALIAVVVLLGIAAISAVVLIAAAWNG